MHTKRYCSFTTIAIGLALCGPQSLAGQDSQPEWRRLLNATKAEQAAWINAHLRAGMPPSETFGDLILNRSDVALPLIEQKIEEVLRSPSPAGSFNTSIDPQDFIRRAASAITEAGDAQSLIEASKLIKIDEKRFGSMVGQILLQARTYRNPFIVAYKGFEIGDPAVNSRIVAWADNELSDKRPPLFTYPGQNPEPRPVEEFEINKVRTWWAEAMLDKYGSVPTPGQWAADPLASRISPQVSGLVHDHVLQIARETLQARSRKR